jgi:hypothetical protein
MINADWRLKGIELKNGLNIIAINFGAKVLPKQI